VETLTFLFTDIEGSTALLRNWLDAHGNEVIIVVCLVLGVWLTGQSIRLLAIQGVR
jgi:hypothetical protein